MPVASVTLIGLFGAVVALASRGWSSRAALGRGLVGAWVGFVVGGTVGLMVDVVSHSGQYVAILGHLGAIVGTASMLRPRPTRARPVR
jgi:hypothetical protein